VRPPVGEELLDDRNGSHAPSLGLEIGRRYGRGSFAAVDAAAALSDLTQVSSQIEGAVLAGSDGTVLASSFDDERGRRIAESALELLRAADASTASSGRAALGEVVAQVAAGAVFVVRSGEQLVAAVTGPEPTVGLVLYDLKTCLRLAEEEKPARPARKSSARRSPAKRPPATSTGRRKPRKGPDA